jgi:hypothetical protein
MNSGTRLFLLRTQYSLCFLSAWKLALSEATESGGNLHERLHQSSFYALRLKKILKGNFYKSGRDDFE